MRPPTFALVLFAAPLAAQSTLGWTQVASTGPAARYLHAMAHDDARGRTILFSGFAQNNETWAWNGTSWSLAANTGPAARWLHGMVYDRLRQRVVLFGGVSSLLSPARNDTWEWDGTTWTQMVATAPQGRYAHGIAYDSVRARTVVFGGFNNGNLGDTWEWDGTTWTPATPPGASPSARAYFTMAFDSAHGQTVLFGGIIGTTGYLGDTWLWDGTTWTQSAATGPSPRQWHTLAYDDQRVRTVLFGGHNGSWLGDTWEWDGAAWTQASIAPSPVARRSQAMVFDAARSRMVMFGGNANGTSMADTWELTFGSAGAGTSYGTGCGAPPLQLAQVPTSQPVLGNTARATISAIPSGFAFVALGWSNSLLGALPLPLDLTPFDLPGCSLLQSTDIASALPTTAGAPGTATFALALPYLPSFLGTHIYVQTWAPAPGVNLGGLVTSNGLDWQLGNR